ncbi:MAG: hypothetical protein OEM05_01385, partial [Myxococcales bacterium]|nr:hypothetical protein [Myxococcales bacterium]
MPNHPGERTWRLPPVGGTPSSAGVRTTPGSFANPGDVGGRLAFSSPDTPGMPAASDRTAWDFMPADWMRRDGRWTPPAGFTPVTQLEHARVGAITPEMR